MLLAKYGQARELCEELKLILGVSLYADELNSLSISEENLESLKSTLRLDHIKEKLLKIKSTLKNNIEFHGKPANDMVGPTRRKEAHNVHKQSQHMYDFLDIWIRQMLAARTASYLQKTRL